jgi:predicted transcriptional regulator
MDNVQAQPSKLSEARAINQETIALVAGEEIQQLPKDLYIPRKRLRYFLKPLKVRWICFYT